MEEYNGYYMNVIARLDTAIWVPQTNSERIIVQMFLANV